MKYLKVAVVYDNEKLIRDLETGWGFSCFVNDGDKILFDTGWDGNLLLRNLRKLRLNPEDLDKVVLSHSHWDHAGGLSALLSENDHLEVYVLPSFSRNLKREIRKRAKLIEVKKGMRISENCLTTGELGKNIKEQSLLAETKKGILVLTGCSHPGVDEILREAENYGDVYGIIGGFHGFSNLKALQGLSLVVPCHCTQKKKEIEEFSSALKCGVGMELTFEL